MEKMVALVGVQNIYYTAKQSHDSDSGYNKVWSKATSNTKLVKAIAYTIVRDEYFDMRLRLSNLSLIVLRLLGTIVSYVTLAKRGGRHLSIERKRARVFASGAIK